MGMYTHVRGWISLKGFEMTQEKFNERIKLAEDISPRSNQCIVSTVFNKGFDLCDYIFIGGQIKNYDDDWNIFLKFIKNNFDILEYNLEKRYEKANNWTKIDLTTY